MTIRHLRIFVAVCRTGSITGAAKALNMTQPAVSLAIKELEEGYGIRLFDRLTRKISITSDGERLLDYALTIVSLFDDMEGAVRNPDICGLLRIGSSLTIGACLLPGYVRELSGHFPEVKASVTVDNSGNIERAVRSGQLDIGLVEGTVKDELLTAEPFMEDELIAVCGNGHPFARAEAVTLDDFLREPLLLRESGSGTRELFQSAVMLRGKRMEPAWVSVSTTALLRAIEAGLGVSVLPGRLAAEYLSAGRVKQVPLQSTPLRRSFYLTYRRNKYLSGSMRAFIAVVRADSPGGFGPDA